MMVRRRAVSADFPARLRELREARELPRVRLAVLAQMKYQRLRNLEYLPGCAPTSDELRRLARALSVSESVLTGEPASEAAA